MYKGKVIYNPSGKASEYSEWAANFYNGCSAMCEYCYNRHGRGAKVLGGDVPTLKKTLISELNAICTFGKELQLNLVQLKKYGLLFNFVSDPCLPETYNLNFSAIEACHYHNVPTKILTKQTLWINEFIRTFEFKSFKKELFAFGFTLTGKDELEPGAATNLQRIEAMKKLHNAGFKTWASIEPIIDFDSSYYMIRYTINHCDLYKIGLKSGGTRYDREELKEFIKQVNHLLREKKTPVYWKDSLLKVASTYRINLPFFCVSRDFNLFK